MKLLIVEDEAHLAEGLRFNLEAEGFEVTVREKAEQALALIGDGERFDAILLDVMLPGMNGFQAVAQLRAEGCFVPVLMLTARGRPEDILQGFDSGADDYLPKPFDLTILLARVNGLLRRAQWTKSGVERNVARGEFEFAGRKIDFANLELVWGDKRTQLTVMEANLLKYLLDREGQTVSRKELLEAVWGVREDTDTRAVDNFIVRLRKYLESEPSQPQYLVTVRGVGYRFNTQADG